MKRTPIKRGKPLARKSRLKSNRNGSMFPLTAEDKAQWRFMKPMTEYLGPCDCECGRWGYRQRCHLHARSRGGRVENNVVLLVARCHGGQEKRTNSFMAELAANGRIVDLYATARQHTAQWRKETRS